MMEFLFEPQTLISLITLVFLEIVLGVDNLVFIAILTDRLPAQQQPSARKLGLTLACVSRLVLLALAFWVVSFNQPLFSFSDYHFSVRDLFLIGGGLFLILKGVSEMHDMLEGGESSNRSVKKQTYYSVIFQIMIIDIVFSFDSVITAVGLTPYYTIMAIAIIVAVLMMILASEPLCAFINKHPTIKMLALSFLLLIGVVLVADGFSFHVPRPYIYFSMGFAVFVELLNMWARRNRKARLKQKL